MNRKTALPQTERPTCSDHYWCWGSCVTPEPPTEPVEHRTYFRVIQPEAELTEKRPDHRRTVSTGMAIRGDGEPLVVLSIQDARRSMEVRLTFWEMMQISGDLAHAGAVQAREVDKDTKLLWCERCKVRFHPDALGGHGRPCRDCGGKVVEIDR